MAISEKSILDPDPPKPGIPLKKSTLAVLLILVLVLGVISSLVFTSQGPSAPTAVAKDASELKQLGTVQTIKDEEVAAERLSKPALSAAAGSRTTATPLPAGTMTVALPPGVRRDDNVGALLENKRRAPPQREGDVEQEAAVRIAKALVHDFDEPANDKQEAGANRPRGAAPSAMDFLTGGTPQVPSSYVAGQLENLKTQLQLGQAPGRSEQGWLREYAKEGSDPRKILSGYPKAAGLVLQQGKIIPAVLGRQINSDLPGRITAYVSSNVYDAAGRLVIPKGSSLIGRYDSGVRVGQSRLLFAFERLILTNGYSFDLPAAPGTDLAGAAGMSGDVNNHFFKMFGSSLLIGFLAARTRQPASVTSINGSGPTTAAGQVLSDVSKSILERNRVIQPTITVEQGTRINVEVVADMVFPDTNSSQAGQP